MEEEAGRRKLRGMVKLSPDIHQNRNKWEFWAQRNIRAVKHDKKHVGIAAPWLQ